MSDMFAAPTPEEIAQAKSQVSNDMFAPPTAEEIAKANEPEDDGKFESAVSGLAHGLTFNQSDKMIAGARALGNSIGNQKSMGDLYNQYLTEQLSRSNRLREDNTKSYIGGELAGGLGSGTVLPTGGGILGNIATGAGVGALAATGQSDAHPLDSPQQASRFASDAYSGLKTGAMGGAIGSTIGAGIGMAGAAPKKAASVLLGANEDSVGRYIANPKAVMNAPSVEDTVPVVKELLGKLKQNVIDSSANARSMLGDDARMTGNEISDIFQKPIDAIMNRSEGTLTTGDQATVNLLKSQQAPWETQVGPSKQVSGSRVKDLIQDIDRNFTDYSQLPGEFSGADQAALKGVRQALDTKLKEASPDYADAMTDVARKTQLLDQAQSLFASDQGLANTLNRVRRDRAPFAEKIFDDIDKEFGTSITDDLRNSLARESFEKGAQGPGGSRNVQMYRHVLGDGIAGRAGSALLGGTIDKYGPGMAKGGIDAYRAVTNNPAFQAVAGPVQGALGGTLQNPNISGAVSQYLVDRNREAPEPQKPTSMAYDIGKRVQSSPESLGKFAQPLQAAAQRGPQALAAAHYVFSQNDPEYQRMFDSQGP